jgi:NAD(P)-dependent dehydrogenase (short-subunit alcohol dehydrogenase family)
MFQHPFQLHGKTVLVTGASSGIGRAVAVECARVGARLVISGRNQERLDETMAMMAAVSSVDHVACAADLTDAAQLDAAGAAAGEVDGVVHAAGISSVAPMRMLRQSAMQNTLDNNLHGAADADPAAAVQEVAAQRRLAGVPVVDRGPYRHARPVALRGVEGGAGRHDAPLALEIAPRGMRANALAPGIVDTPMVNRDDDLMDAQRKLYPLGLGKPEDVAYAAIYLLSDASRKVTGTQPAPRRRHFLDLRCTCSTS